MKYFFVPKYFEESALAYKIIHWYRLLFCFSIAFHIFLDRSFFLDLSRNERCYPIEVFQWLHIPLLKSSIYGLAVDTLILSLLIAGIGLLGRLSIFVSLLLFFLVLGQSIGCDRGQFGFYTSWQHCIVIFNLMVLCFCSTHSMISRGESSKNNKNKLEIWTVELLKFNLVYSYFAGGIVKIRSGFEWMNGYTLQGHIFHSHLESDLPLAYSLAQNLTLMKIISIATVVVELLYPIVLITRPQVGWFFASITLFMQMIFWLLIDLQWMKYFGWSYLVYFLEILFLVEWKKKTFKAGRPRNIP